MGVKSDDNLEQWMTTFTNQLKQAYSALAYADCGEMLGRRDMSRVLGNSASPAPTGNRKRIALSLGDTLPGAVTDYLLGVCPRMNADLIVLCSDAGSAARLLEPSRAAFREAGIAVSTCVLPGNATRAMAHYLNNNPQVLFVVSSGNDDPVHNLMMHGNRRNHAATQLPIVVVSEERSPSRRDVAKRNAA